MNNLNDWFKGWASASLKDVDISHNQYHSPSVENDPDWQLQISSAVYPNLASFKASHNSFGGILSLTTTSFNFDFSYNRISAILLFSGGIVQVGTASQHTEFLSMKVDHQNTSKVDLPVDHPNQTVVGFVKDQKNGKIFESIDTALSSLDFASAMPFLPTSDFTRYEYPAGSSLYPFSCPRFSWPRFPESRI